MNFPKQILFAICQAEIICTWRAGGWPETAARVIGKRRTSWRYRNIMRLKAERVCTHEDWRF